MSTDPFQKQPEAALQNALKATRTRLGLSQAEVAARAGVARQTVGGIEAALYAPSAAVALRLARALGCRVEELFWLEDEPAHSLRVTLAHGTSATAERFTLAQVEGRWVAHVLSESGAFRFELIPADALARPGGKPRPGAKPHKGVGSGASKSPEMDVDLLDSPTALARTVLIAGCSPAISLWTRSAERWHPGLRPAWIFANSTVALQSLARGEVHIAGIHLCDPVTGEENAPFVRETMGATATALINFGVWDEGLLLQRGNPLGVKTIEDIANPAVRFLNREPGAGSRLLFDTLLGQAGIPTTVIAGYDAIATSHQAVARAIADGETHAGMGTAAMAQLYNLHFLPLRRVRFDFAVRASSLTHEPVAQLFETLAHKSVRLQLQTLGGYDTGKTGEIVERL